MNRIEALKAARDGLDVAEDLIRFAREGWRTIADDDKERLKWAGVFHRKPTPGHFMMRVRMPNGVLTSAQARLLGEITKQTGRNVADVTTRQQIQLRWVTIERVPEVIARLEAAGLSSLQTGMDNIRGIVGCPATGLTPSELIDTAPIAAAFQRIFLGNKAFTNLPRKFNVTITGCPDNCTAAETQDIAMTPAVATLDGAESPASTSPWAASKARAGRRRRAPRRVRAARRGGGGVRGGRADLPRSRAARGAQQRAAGVPRRGVGGRAVPQGAGGQTRPAAAGSGRDARSRVVTDHVGVFRQREAGLSYVGLKTPVGRITGDQLARARAAGRGVRPRRAAHDAAQNVLLPHVSDARLGALLDEPLLRELRYNPSEVQRGVIACTGTDFCNLALIDTKTRAMALARAFEARLGTTRPITVRWSGCPAACGNHHTADVGLQGCKVKVNGKIVDGVHVFVGGRGGPDPRAGVEDPRGRAVRRASRRPRPTGAILPAGGAEGGHP